MTVTAATERGFRHNRHQLKLLICVGERAVSSAMSELVTGGRRQHAELYKAAANISALWHPLLGAAVLTLPEALPTLAVSLVAFGKARAEVYAPVTHRSSIHR